MPGPLGRALFQTAAAPNNRNVRSAAEGSGTGAALKISGACTLSHRRFPYDDIWDPIRRLIDAFGIERCMWGTDWTRAVALLTYKEGFEAFRTTDRLSKAEGAALMGGTLTKIYRWAP